MADFTKFKVGSTSYNVKDANAGKSLSISGSDLSLKNAAGNTISTVTLPGGSGAYIILSGAYNAAFSALIIRSVTSYTNHTITTFQDLYNAVINDGAVVYLVDTTSTPAEITPLSYIHASALDPDGFEVGFIGVTKGWQTSFNLISTILDHPFTAYVPSSGSSPVNSHIIWGSNTALSSLLSSNTYSMTVNTVFINGQGNNSLSDLFNAIADAVSTFASNGIDLKISIRGQDFTADVISYDFSGSDVTILFDVIDPQQHKVYRKTATFDLYSASTLSIAQAQ